jgi:hypothetical protein
MQHRWSWLASLIVIGAALGLAPTAAAHERVDPTTLTPPLRPFRVCFADGPWVRCDTSTVTITENEPAGEFSCGQVYLTMTESGQATRWYRDLLLVERNATYKMRGSWSLAPDGSGPSVAIAADFSWHETFPVPGDLSSDVEVSHGNFIRVAGFGAIGADSGIFKADGTFRGHAGEDDPAEDAAVCRLLEG